MSLLDEVNRYKYITMTAKVVRINRGIFSYKVIFLKVARKTYILLKSRTKFKLLFTKRKISKQHYTIRGLNEEQVRFFLKIYMYLGKRMEKIVYFSFTFSSLLLLTCQNEKDS